MISLNIGGFAYSHCFQGTILKCPNDSSKTILLGLVQFFNHDLIIAERGKMISIGI